MSDQYVEPVTLPLLVVDIIRYYRQFYFGDKIMVMYSGEYSDKRVVGVFDNAYSIINKMIIETERVYIDNTSHTIQHKNIKILGWYFYHYEFSNRDQLLLSFPITKLLTADYPCKLGMRYIDSQSSGSINFELQLFNLNDICYGDNWSAYLDLSI
jgi:hypothetical protein